MEEIRTLIAALFGTLGFSLLFKNKPSALMICTIGGTLSWAVVLISLALGAGIFTSNLFAAIFSIIFSSCVSPRMKLPSTVLITPCMIPLVPGGSLYYTMQSLISNDLQGAYTNGINTLLTVFGIAGGIVIGSILYSAFNNPKLKNMNRIIKGNKKQNHTRNLS